MGKSKTLGDAVAENKVRVSNLIKTIKRVITNAERLVIAASLLVVTVFAYTNLKDVSNQTWRYIVVVCLVIVGLYAFAQLVKFLDRD